MDLNILVVDDTPEIRAQLVRVLSEAGHRVAEAPDGRRALERLDVERPDLMLTDLLMPEMDGIELIRTVRQRGMSLPIVAMSGGGQVEADDYLHMASLLGASAVLSKPFRRKELLGIVERLFPDDG